MKLCQGQVYKLDQEYVRVVAIERLAVDYMTMKTPETKGGVHKRVTKKQFCTFVKTATLISPVSAKPSPLQGESKDLNR